MNFDQILNAQREYFFTHETKALSFRIARLRKLKQILKENESKLHDAIYLDYKKSSFENDLTELTLIYHEINVAIKNLYRWAKRERVGTDILSFPAKSYIIKEPLGVVLVIGAWNFPYNLSIIPSVAAIAAGNTVIIKPSEIPSRTSSIMAELINTNFDKNYLHVIEGGIPETTALLEQRFDKIFFTGSTRVGRIVYTAAAKNLTPVTLELGGKTPTFFHKDANLNVGIKRMVWAKFLNSGQICICPDYVMVHEEIIETFLKKLTAEIDKHNYSFEKGNYVQIINKSNLQRLSKMLNGANIFYGGTYSESDRYMEPTILYPVELNDAVMQEEIFGPILPILTYKTIDEAINITQQFEKPLSCYIYTRNRKVKERILKEVSFGAGCVNESIMHFTNNSLPFGGVGESGFGSYHGKFGFEAFSHKKSVLEKPTWMELNIKYYNYTKSKLKIIKRLILSGLKLS